MLGFINGIPFQTLGPVLKQVILNRCPAEHQPFLS